MKDDELTPNSSSWEALLDQREEPPSNAPQSLNHTEPAKPSLIEEFSAERSNLTSPSFAKNPSDSSPPPPLDPFEARLQAYQASANAPHIEPVTTSRTEQNSSYADSSFQPQSTSGPVPFNPGPIQQENAPPFRPDRYDASLPHQPELAYFFSIVTPGAGELYNGDDVSLGRSFLNAIFVLPWVRSARSAREHARKIATYYAPKPSEGSTKRAVARIATFWGTIAGVIVLAVVGYKLAGTSIRDASSKVAVSEDATSRAVSEAAVLVVKARVDAFSAATEADRQLAAKRESLSPEERVARLYAVGYQVCLQNDFPQCVAIMRRVTNLDKSNFDAVRLQVWASARLTGAKEAFPDVKKVTLEDVRKRFGNSANDQDSRSGASSSQK